MKKSILLALLSTAVPLFGTTFSGTVSGDTYIRNDGTPTTNSNADPDNEMLVGSNGGSDNLRALLKFNVASIVNDVNTIGGGNFANLTINSASLQVFERRGRANTVNFIVKSYGYAFDPATSTWNAPATGDATAGGTLGATLGSQSLAWDATADNQNATIALTPSGVSTAIAGHLSNSLHLMISTDTPATQFLSITSDLSPTTTRHTKLTIDYTVTPAGGPLLTIDPASPQPDFSFPFSSTTASPLTRTVRYKNTGTSGAITVSGITVTNTTGTAFSLGSVSPALPATLAVGQTIDIPILASSAAGGSFTGSVFVNTDLDAQDKTLPLSASFYQPGTIYSSNSSMTTDLANWVGGSTFVTPGFITTGDGMARVRGNGDPLQPVVKSSLSQATAIPNNLPDWELDFRFSPIAPLSFADFAGQPADGQFGDRTFQLVVQSDDASVPAPNLTSAFDDNTLINIAYFPDGIVTGGIAGFYLYNGVTDTWQLVDFNGDGSALVLAGSVDVDSDANPANGVGDGILNSSGGDTVNVYRMTIRGSNFGSPSASYSITLKGPGAGFPKTVTGLTLSHNQAVTTALPASFGFITSDTSAESNASSGLCPSFWVDEIGYFAVARPAQRLLAFNTPPSTLRSLNGATLNHTVSFYNDGTTGLVNLSATLGGTSAVTLASPPSFPVAIAPGGLQTLTLAFDPALLAVPNTAAPGSFGITSDDASLASATYPFTATKVTDANLLANGDFESATGTGTFPLGWTLIGTPSSISPFLASGGGAAAVSLAPSQGIYQDIAPAATDALEDFQTDFAFQIGNETQAHRIRMEGDNGADLVTIRLTTSPTATDSIEVYNAGTWVAALGGLTIAPNTTYHIRVIGRKCSQAGRKYTIGFSTDGVTYTTSASLTAFHATPPAKFETATFECGATAGSSLSIDNATIKVAPADDLAAWMDGFTFAPGANTSASGDADNDGISNLVENVLGTPPNAASTGLTQISANAASVSFQHPLNPTLASDVTYTYQWSTDLTEWKSSGQSNTGGITATIVPTAPVSGIVTVTTTATVGTPVKLFTRLVANQNP